MSRLLGVSLRRRATVRAGSAVLFALLCAAQASAFTVDGTVDASYGAPIVVQTVQTQFGDAMPPGNLGGSELDAAFARIEGGRLFLMFTGNLEPNFTKLDIFIDSIPGGETTLSATPDYDFFAAGGCGGGGCWISTNLNGLTFDAGFAADYHLFARWGSGAGPLLVDFVDRQGGGAAMVPGSNGVASATAGLISTGMIAAGSVGPNASGTALTQPLEFAINDNNALGVIGGTAAANQAAAAAVATGMEFSIDLLDIGNPGPGSVIRVSAMINNGDHNFMSNQILGGVPAPQGNLGGDGMGNFSGDLSGLDFNDFGGAQSFMVPVPGTGACCLCDGTCMELAESVCLAMGTVQVFTPGAACMDVTCVAVEDPVLITGPTTVCPGTQDIDYSVTNPNPNAAYAWVLGGTGATVDGATDMSTVRVDAVNGCNEQFTLIVTCTAGDCVTTGMITVAVDDNTPPVAPAPPADVIVQCAAAVPAPVDLTAVDNCDGDITVSPTAFLMPGSCSNKFTVVRTWTFIDGCGNQSSVSQTITVDDNTPPVAPANPAGISFQCLGDEGDASLVMMTAPDNCDGDITVGGVDGPLVGGTCGGTITRTWTFTDACGNSSVTTQVNMINDTTPPAAPANPAGASFQCLGDEGDASLVMMTAVDNCDGPITVGGVDGPLVGGACGGTITRTWTFTDACGNSSVTTQINMIDDTTAPAAPANPAGASFQCLGDEGDASLVMMTAPDNCDGDITVGGVDGPLVGGACGGTITRTWTFTDACGNSSVTTQINMINDTTAPAAPANPADLDFQCATDVPPPGDMTATDNCAGAITVTGVDTDNGGAGCVADPLVITRTWTFADACGNTSATTQMITVIDDTMPTIACPGLIVVSCADGPPPPNPGSVTAADNCGTVVVTHVSDVDSNAGCPRTVTRTYRATDPCGNFADCTQTILVDRLHPGWNYVDNGITLTANEPTYWSALTGQPKGVSPFTVLDPAAGGSPPGRPAMDGTQDRVLRGYVIAWAVDQFGDEIRWNHLKGEGTIVNYRDTASWEYNTWNHAVVANVANGEPLAEPGVLRLDGLEYSLSFDELLLNFQAAGSGGFSSPPMQGFVVESDTDLTLFPPAADLRQNNDGPVTTKASMDIWNENETKFSGTHRCITCWDQTLISRYDTPNSFLFPFLQTDHGKARIDGHAADVCNVLDDPMTPEDESVTSIFAPLLGVYARHMDINGNARASSGSNLVGMGTDDTAVIQYDVAGGGGPPEGQMPTDPLKLIDWFVRIAESRTEIPRIGEAPHVEHNEMPELSGIGQDRVSGTEKGSLLFFSKVELRWGGPPMFPLIQDTFLSITNDFPEDVRVQMYFINGDAPITATPGGP